MAALGELLDDLGAEGRPVLRGAAGDEALVRDDLLVDTGAAGELLSAPDPEAAVRIILGAAVDPVGFEQTYIYAAAPGGERIALTHSIGIGEGLSTFLGDVSCDQPLCGIVARTGKPFVLARIQEGDEPRHALAKGRG